MPAPGAVWLAVPNPVTLNAPFAFLPKAVEVIPGNLVTIPFAVFGYALKFKIALYPAKPA